MTASWSQVTTKRGCVCRVLTAGTPGSTPVVFFHGAGGLDENDPLVMRLAERYQIYAPELPGYGESTGEDLLEDMLDFTLHGWDVVGELGLRGNAPALIGHSMGAMIAAEMACIANERVEKLVLLAPIGLWIDEHPIPDIFATLPHDMPALMFHDPAAGAAAMTRGSDFSDPDALLEFFIGNARRLGTAGKITFPIPNRRLSKRLYRLQADTLLVFGESDRLLPAPYAERWQQSIRGSQLVTIAEAGHVLYVEQPELVAAAVEKFLG